MTIKYHDIAAAKGLLDLPDRASMEDIKASYRKLIKQWHPDKCKGNDELCNEMTKKITMAYKVVISYCHQYQYSFTEDEVKRYLSAEDWWVERFGDDPLWGKMNKH